MTEFSFQVGWAMILNAMPNQTERIGHETRDIYWAQLSKIPDDLWHDGVQRCLRTCRFFPTIAELGNACLYGKRFLAHPHNRTELTWEDALRVELREREKAEAKRLQSCQVESRLETLTKVDVKTLLRQIVEKLDAKYGGKNNGEQKEGGGESGKKGQETGKGQKPEEDPPDIFD